MAVSALKSNCGLENVGIPASYTREIQRSHVREAGTSKKPSSCSALARTVRGHDAAEQF